jgi:hypothetical protein
MLPGRLIDSQRKRCQIGRIQRETHPDVGDGNQSNASYSDDVTVLTGVGGDDVEENIANNNKSCIAESQVERRRRRLQRLNREPVGSRARA